MCSHLDVQCIRVNCHCDAQWVRVEVDAAKNVFGGPLALRVNVLRWNVEF